MKVLRYFETSGTCRATTQRLIGADFIVLQDCYENLASCKKQTFLDVSIAVAKLKYAGLAGGVLFPSSVRV
jgi:hypothetical protein